MNEEKTVLGDIRIINRDDLELILCFKRDSNGSLWTIETLDSLFIDSEYDKLIDVEKLKDFYYQFQKTQKDYLEIEIARSKSPKIPMDPNLEWFKNETPMAYKGIAKKLAEESPLPIFYIETEKEASTTSIAHTDTNSSTEKDTVETTQKTLIKQKTLAILDKTFSPLCFVKKGQNMGVKKGVLPVENGIDLLGQEVIPEQTSNPYFLTPNIQIDLFNIIAKETGFLRTSSNWAEIIPYSSCGWFLNAHKDFLFLNFIPGEDEDLPDLNQIFMEAEDKGFLEADLISKKELDTILKEYVYKNQPLKDFQLTKNRDAFIDVLIDNNKTKASLFIKKTQNGTKPLSLGEIGQQINKTKLKGLKLEKLKKDLITFYKSEDLILNNYLLCTGKEPTRGSDREVTYSVNFLNNETTETIKEILTSRPLLLEYSSNKDFPSSKIQHFSRVTKDQEIGKLNSSKPGKPGINVFGEKIAPPPGNDPVIHLYENVYMNQDSIIANRDGILDHAEINGELFLRLRKHKDAEAEVKIENNSMQAYITIHVEEGSGIPLNKARLLEILKEQQVTKGIIEENVQTAISKYREGCLVSNMLIAEGQAPKDRIDRLVKFNIDLSTNKKVFPDASGKMDFKQPKKIIPLKKDDLIGIIKQVNDEDANGFNVMGVVIPSKSNETIDIEIGPNIYQKEKNNQIELYAAKNGAFYSNKNKIDVIDKKVIKGDIDYSTGNIKFPGSVIVQGSVLSGFYIVAGEKIVVNEVVQGSLLSADGSIMIKGGIKGEDKAVLSSKMDISCAFIEQAHLMASNGILIQKTCLRSKIRCNGYLKFVSAKSRIIGGETKSRQGLEVWNIGNESETKTKISFGQDYVIDDRIRIEEREISKLKEEIKNIDDLMNKYENSNFKEKLIEIRQKKLKCFKLLEKRNVRLFNLTEKFEQHYDSKIVIKGTLFPGVTIESHGRLKEYKEQKSSFVIFFNQQTGHIEEKPL